MEVSFKTRDIVYISVESIISAISLVANGLVVAVLWKFPVLRTVPNILLRGLVIADLLVSLGSVPISATSFIGVPRNFYACTFLNSLVVAFAIVSNLIILTLTLERFVAIRFPVKHRRMLHMKRRAVGTVVVAFIVGMLLGMMPVMGWHVSPANFTSCSFISVIPLTYMVYFFFMGFVLPSLVIMMFVYASIFVVFRRVVNTSGQRSHTFKCIVAIVVSYAVCWVPIHISNAFFVIGSVPSPQVLVMALALLSHSNAAINPFLYAFFVPSVRKAIHRLLWCRFQKKEGEDTTTATTPTSVSLSDMPQTRKAHSVVVSCAKPLQEVKLPDPATLTKQNTVISDNTHIDERPSNSAKPNTGVELVVAQQSQQQPNPVSELVVAQQSQQQPNPGSELVVAQQSQQQPNPVSELVVAQQSQQQPNPGSELVVAQQSQQQPNTGSELVVSQQGQQQSMTSDSFNLHDLRSISSGDVDTNTQSALSVSGVHKKTAPISSGQINPPQLSTTMSICSTSVDISKSDSSDTSSSDTT